jgi:rare lipoprotein A
MYAMTAAHKTLPLPSYARVRNPANGRSVIVRVNDRGPFHDGRVIDLSYTAALKLDLLRGVAPVEIERITNEDIRTGAWRGGEPARLAQAGPAAGADGIAVAGLPGPAGASPSQEVAASSLAAQAVAVPAALTAQVADRSRFADMEIAPLPPLAPAAAPAGPSGASAPSAPEASPLPRAGGAAAGYWVQLGAFGQAAGAQRLQQQVARELPALAGSLQVFGEQGTHRLQSGPYASREQALAAAEQLRSGLKLAPVIVKK